jgi:hypothetical protein
MNLGTTSGANFNYSTSNLFVEAWVYLNSTMIDAIISRDNGGSNFDWDLDVRNTSGPAFFVNTSLGQKVTSNGTSLSLNTWIHLACGIDVTNSNLYIYVNGGVTTPTSFSGGTINYNSGYRTCLGTSGRLSSSTLYANQYIRDLRVVQGGVVPTTSFTPGSAPFSYTLPSYVTGSGSVVFTLLGQFVTYPSGKYGQGIYFNNKNSVGTGNNANTYTYYNISSSLQLSANNLTVSSWVNPYFSIPAPSSNQKWVMIGDSQFTIEFALNTNVSSTIPFVYFAGNNTGLLTGTTPMVQNQWFHQAVTFSNINSTSANTLCSYYFNGAYISSSNVSKTSFSTINGLQIGTGFGNWAGAWVALDDLRIYNTALTAAQVQSVYSSQGAPAPSRAMPLPTLAWDFNGTTTDYVSRVIPVSSAGFSYSTGKYQQGASFTNTVGSTPTNYIVYDFTAISSAAFTVCCWVNTVVSAGGGIAVSIAGGNREGDIRIFLGGTSPGNILTQYRMLTTPPSTYTYVNASSATNSVVAGVWNHIAVTITESSVNGSVLSCFFNGSLASTTTSAYGAPRNLNGMGVGAFYSLLFNNGYNGLIDDLRIYNTALTAAQVGSIWAQQGVPGRGALVPQSPQPSLVWQFESSNVDSVTGLAPTTSVGPPTYNSAGKYGSSIVFNNTPGAAPGTYYLTYTTGISLSTASGFTVCAWLKPLAVGVSGNQTFLSIAGQNTFFIFQIDGSATNIHLFGQNPFTVPNNINGGSASVTQSTWIHAVMVFSGTSITTYYNGTLKDSLSLVVSPVTFSSIGLGNRSAINADSAANCELDDLRVYNTALTAAQVQAIYGTSGMPSRQVLTGTPLFTQLSAYATSSAVGAFSLRAVNGTSARAVAVQVHPVVAYPPASLTSNTTTLSAQTYGNGTYTTVASSYNAGGGIYEAWRSFTNVSNWWRPSGATYNGTTGIYVGTTYSTVSGGVTYYGEWLQIQLPNKIRLVNYTLDQAPVLAGGQLNSTPLTFYVFGSNDSGTTWTLIDAQDVPVYTTQTFVVPSANATTTYDWFRLSVNKIPPSTTVLRVAKWILNGSADNYATGSATDFYADRLGNLLTAPVTGQSLASWLGGGTGYVTTWYDQSGAGNHATQATAANQPIITRATKGPGYACYFVGNPNQMSFNTPTGNIFDNTDYSILVVNRRTIPFTPYQYFFGTFPPSAGSPRIGFGYTADNRVRFRKENLAVGEFINCIVPGYAGISEPTGYDYGVFSQTSGMNSYSWRSGNQTTATNATYTTPLTLSGPAIIGAQRNNQYFTGEIYEVLVFTKSLYDIDGTSTITQIYQNQLGAYGT